MPGRWAPRSPARPRRSPPRRPAARRPRLRRPASNRLPDDLRVDRAPGRRLDRLCGRAGVRRRIGHSGAGPTGAIGVTGVTGTEAVVAGRDRRRARQSPRRGDRCGCSGVPTRARATATTRGSVTPTTRSRSGTSTSAVTPPPGLGVSVTRRPCRRASRPTTNRPSTSVGTRSSRSRWARRAFSSAIRSAVMPRPWSTTSSRTPRAGHHRGHGDPGARRRERRRVLHQLGEHEHQVADDRRRHRMSVGHLDVDPGVVLDLTERQPDDVGQRKRGDVAVGAGRAGEHDEAARAAAQPAGDVVEPVEVLQPARVGLLPLQPVDQRELPADQVLRAPADVAEHLRHVAPADDLPLDQPGRGVLHPVERPGQVADLVAGRGRRPDPAGPARAARPRRRRP